MMEKVLEVKLPPSMLLRSSYVWLHNPPTGSFSPLYRIPASTRDGRLRWPEKAKSEDSIRYVEQKVYPLREMLDFDDMREANPYALHEAIASMLIMDPVERIEARDALELGLFNDEASP
jgi:hypothetical protein